MPSLCDILRLVFAINHANATPILRPPIERRRKFNSILERENVPVVAAKRANLNATKPVASLIRLSPFRMVVHFVGARSLSVMDEIAIASVGEMIAPRANAKGNDMPGIR